MFSHENVEVFADMSCFHLPWTEQVQYPHTFLILIVITCGFYYMNGGSKEEESLLVVTLPELQSSKLFPKVLRHHCPNYPLSHRRLLGLLPTFAFKSPVYTTWELLWSCCMGFLGSSKKCLSEPLYLTDPQGYWAQWSEHRICCKKNLSNKLGNAKKQGPK